MREKACMYRLRLHPSIARLAWQMQRKLDRDQHKSGWLDGTPAWHFISRLFEEVDEMRRAPECEVWLEAADVANFAMMYADAVSHEQGV